MHDIELLAIWFSLEIGGAILTMLMSRMVSAERSSAVTHDMCQRKGAMVLSGSQAYSSSSLARYLHRHVNYLVFIEYCVKEPDEADGLHGFGAARP